MAGGLVLAVAGLSSPMLLIIPMAIFACLGRRQIGFAARWLPRPARFPAAILLFGLLTESFAIATNLPRQPNQRVLLDPNPIRDLFLALGYYGAVAVAWTALLARRAFSARDLFLVTGAYGIVVEESGAVLLGIFSIPVLGAVYALFIACVYGLFPSLALLVTADSLPKRQPPSNRARFAAFGVLLVQYVVCGLLVLPLMRAL